MPTKRLEFESPYVLEALLAEDEKLLNYLDDELQVKSITRDHWIEFKGDSEALDRSQRVFDDLLLSYKQKQIITPSEFKLAIELSKGSSDLNLSSLSKLKLLGNKGKPCIMAKNPEQLSYLQSMIDQSIVFGLGPAGTGKTYLAMAMALSLLEQKKIQKIYLTRPAVEAGEELGFLPGDLHEKVAPYLTPLYDAMQAMLQQEEINHYLQNNIIEIAPLAYMRGRTLANAFVILDEAQNTTCEQMYMLLTRLGENSHCAVTGDLSQIDLKPRVTSGLREATQVLKSSSNIAFHHFTTQAIVRHPLVKEIIESYEKHRNPGSEN